MPWTCEFCQEENIDDAEQFCPECGAERPLHQESQQTSPTDERDLGVSITEPDVESPFPQTVEETTTNDLEKERTLSEEGEEMDEPLPPPPPIDISASGETLVEEPQPIQKPLVLVLLKNGGETEEKFEILGDVIIGRFSPDRGPVDIDLVEFPGQQYVSRHHAQITLEDGTWNVQDLHTVNHTWLNGMKIDEQTAHELNEGDVLAFGTMKFKVHL
ncbi:MAG TPA: FHA domain-containing protein [Thermotogota bacterium]|nr:FHA domain-containing protein [Thermotogota bacterium]